MKQGIERMASGNREVVKFIVLLLVFTVIFHVIYQYFIIGKEHFLRETTALIVGFCLNLLGAGNTVNGADIIFVSAPAFNLIYGCIGVYPIMVFVACVLAYPTTFRNKIIGIVPGVILLYVIEIVRLTFLGVINLHYPDLFDVTHVYLWQATLVIFVLLLLFLWITRIVEREEASEENEK
jgi:archaeosortase B (VPXXXP-CTERM-specific)